MNKEQQIIKLEHYLRNKHTIEEYETGKVDVADLHDEATEIVESGLEHDCKSDAEHGCEFCSMLQECGIIPEADEDCEKEN